MRSFGPCAMCFLIMLSFAAPAVAQEAEEHVHVSRGSEEGLGRAHMEISCSPAVAAKFDRALAFVRGRDGCVGIGAKGTCGGKNVSAREALSQRGRRSVQGCWRGTESRAGRRLP